MAKFSEILHVAADKYLSEKQTFIPKVGINSSYFTCDCVRNAAMDEFEYNAEKAHKLIGRLEKDLGLDSGFNSFDKFRRGSQRQSVRYAWLKFAAMYYEEQGG